MSHYDDIVVIIPAYNPDEKLIKLTNELVQSHFKHIIVVNDGSNSSSNSIFNSISSSCTILNHAVNLGKGRALKTAFNYYLNKHKDFSGVVTVDSDGQHSVEDIINVSLALKEKKESLILGVRNFGEENIPFRSRFGNIITSKVLNFACGMKITDTQTGLRGIPTSFLKKLMNVKGERFEYEMNMLLECKDSDVTIDEVKIKTIYIEDNKSSHFNPLVDSIKIYSTFIKYLISSFASFGVDILMFYLLSKYLKGILPTYFVFTASIGSRVISSIFNYYVNKNAVFKQHSRTTLIKYFSLSFCQMLVSAYGVHFLYLLIGTGELWLKILVDAFLFLISFQIQQRLIFVKNKTTK